jgi:Big-like domain-containing protein
MLRRVPIQSDLGGVGDTKTETDYFWFDHAHISVRGSAPSDTTPPSVSITAPAANTSVAGTTTVSASASNNVGVAGCNRSSDGYPDNCYSNGTAYVNEKKWRAAAQYFTDSPGPYYRMTGTTSRRMSG